MNWATTAYHLFVIFEVGSGIVVKTTQQAWEFPNPSGRLLSGSVLTPVRTIMLPLPQWEGLGEGEIIFISPLPQRKREF